MQRDEAGADGADDSRVRWFTKAAPGLVRAFEDDAARATRAAAAPEDAPSEVVVGAFAKVETN